MHVNQFCSNLNGEFSNTRSYSFIRKAIINFRGKLKMTLGLKQPLQIENLFARKTKSSDEQTQTSFSNINLQLKMEDAKEDYE